MMRGRGLGWWTRWAFLVLLAGPWPAGCGGDGLGAILDPSRDDRDKGFDPGQGGGSVVKDLFAGAQFSRDEPTIISVKPDDSLTGVSIRTVVAIAFTESMDPDTVNQESVTFRETDSGGSAILVDQIWTQRQTVLVLAPQSSLQEETAYEVNISGSIQDLQGQSLNLGEGQNSVTFSFTTGVDNSELRFDILDVVPKDGNQFAYSSTSILVYLSEPVLTGGGNNALDNPNNFIVRSGGSTVAGGFQLAAGDRVVQFVPDAPYGADTRVDVTLTGNVVSQAGRKLNRGVDYKLDFTTFPTDSVTDIVFPDNRDISAPIDADGFISTVNLHKFSAEVQVASGSPDKVTLMFVDAEADNGLIFDKTGAKSVNFTEDLEPDASVPALADGTVLVGAYATERGEDGPVDLVRVLYKDVTGFGLAALGPPGGGSGLELTLVTPLVDPAIYGQADQPLGAFSLTRAGVTRDVDAIPNWGALLDFDGQTTFDEDATDEDSSLDDNFITPPFASGGIGLNFDPVFLDEASGQDAVGNDGSATLSSAAISQVGIIGGATSLADPSGGLVCTAVGEDTFAVLDDTDVIVEAYPRDETGTGQIVDQVTADGAASFSASDLAALGADLITVTFVHDGYHLLTLAGIKNPASSPAAGYGIQILLEPADPSATIPVSISSSDSQMRAALAANLGLLEDADLVFTEDDQPRRFDSIDVRANRLKAFAVIATNGSGSDPQRFLLTACPVFADGVADVAFDLDGATPFTSTSNSILFQPRTTRASADASGVYDADPAELDIAEARLEARIPGFPGRLPLARENIDLTAGTPQTTLLLPASFAVNNAPSGTPPVGEDTALELMIQPSLAGSGEAVSGDALHDAIYVGLALRNSTDGRMTLVRSRVDFTAISSPVIVDDPIAFAEVPEVGDLTEFDDTHPPKIPFTHTLSKKAIYRMHLVKEGAAIDPHDSAAGTYDRRWDVYTRPGLHSDPSLVVVAFPDLAAADSRRLLDNDVSDFSGPDLYDFGFEGFDFDSLDFNAFAQSQLSRDSVRFVRFRTDQRLQTQ